MGVYMLAGLVGGVVFLVYLYAQYAYGYWRRRGVPCDEHMDFPFGSVKGVSRTVNLAMILKKKYFESVGLPYYGLMVFVRPILLVRSPEVIKEILVKNFSTFHDRGFGFNTEREPLLNHLFFLEGKKWRNMRIKLTPTFTSGKMKMMFPTMLNCSDELLEFLKEPARLSSSVEVKQVFARFTSNIITRCAFGLDIDSFKNPDSEFLKVSRFLFQPNGFQSMKNSLLFAFAKYLYYVPIRLIPIDKSDFFVNAVAEVMKQREDSNIRRNDFMQLLIDLKNKGQLDDTETYSHGDIVEDDNSELSRKFTMAEATAQAFVFFVAGHETASTTLQFCLYELAVNQDIQDKLCEEVDRTFADSGGPTYESIQSMTYLDQVISETLRKYPPAPFVVREANEVIKLSERDLVVEKGQRVMVSLLALHHDPIYFPNPDQFDPDRFSPENKDKIEPYTYMPFGEGPRICIGMRFGQVQVKIGLSQFLSKYRVSLSDKSPTGPLEFDPKAVLLVLKGNMYLKITAR